MKKLPLWAMKGLIVGSSAAVVAGTCAIAINVNNSFKASNESKVSLVENEVMETQKTKELNEAEKVVNESKTKVEEATKEVEKATTVKETATKEVAKAEETITKAKEAKKQAEAEIKNAKTEEERIVALEKIKAATETITKAEATKKEATAKVEKAEKAITQAENKKVEAEKTVKEAIENKKTLEEEIEKTQEKAPETSNKTTTTTESTVIENKNNKSVEKENENQVNTTQENKTDTEESKVDKMAVNAIIKAVKNTQNAKSLTVYDITNKWAKEYDKNNNTELITYYSGSSASNGKSGVLYSYTSKPNGTNSTEKQKSLFRAMSTSIWSIPNAANIKANVEAWEMQFSGKRTVGVPELNLIEKGIEDATLYTNAASLVTNSANSLLQNVSYYKVQLCKINVIKWLSTYYNTNNVTNLNNLKTDSIEIIVGISGGYVTYISNVNNNNTKGFEIMVGQNSHVTAGKFLKFEVVLTNANNTVVPTVDEIGLSSDSVEKLEEEYKAHYGCKKEWVYGDEKYGDYYCWVCTP